MRTLRSYVEGRWHQADAGFVPLHNPCTEEPIAQASSAGVDFGAAYEHARETGGAALAGMTFAQRGELLAAMSKALYQKRDELIELSTLNTGVTRKDAKFDLDGATFTLSYYAKLGKSLGDRTWYAEDEGSQLGRSPRFWGRHLRLPRGGVAVHVNAFNFPAWGLAEKAACALLAGMPVISKPATSSAWVAERCAEILVESGALPAGVFSLICGSSGDLLDRLGERDVFAFTGSADTALELRGKPNLLSASTRVNIEADSLNAAVLAPGLDREGETWNVFLQDVTREITQKTGQKCTAVRRIFVPHDEIDEVQEALCERLSAVVPGDPRDAEVTMGPLATERQLDDAIDGVGKLAAEAQIVHGTGERVDGRGAAPGKGWFFGPTLLRTDRAADVIHRHEVFGPVSTLCAYGGKMQQAAAEVGRARGTLVTSLYVDRAADLTAYLAAGGSTSGRLYVASSKVAAQLPGSGTTLPAMLHGGPGRAGGGEELGGLSGLTLYQQRVAVTGDRALLDRAGAD
ncbi:MAG: 3,4-dehydroadipyl-CoA semialdehyde dehydrogenase [Acidobacteria bacterium]|nr:3,4-dehydroadipyl-CoA semialdehyde dehydrogenase [Acidobacteriota bacterium]NIM60278.1 3,4-dehydroadipyl-CoA semialdehyde dehydrogenase [Acidobacteriota bacterium]NIO57881.1 3,4-dehydroadipyl-CoA semialdehyde dehydrogenase [Acidobacteriota bacterium]NIQ28890.1 3,4-dehydroadipyl-CoA semialdehyde dehydrogenase [Acidobacteriota bacterium]NIQ83348.1 3,4-dehydroadipyl-CoA semialdehyde dehydrogenase [Acidobacteriota bacterium]